MDEFHRPPYTDEVYNGIKLYQWLIQKKIVAVKVNSNVNMLINLQRSELIYQLLLPLKNCRDLRG